MVELKKLESMVESKDDLKKQPLELLDTGVAEFSIQGWKIKPNGAVLDVPQFMYALIKEKIKLYGQSYALMEDKIYFQKGEHIYTRYGEMVICNKK